MFKPNADYLVRTAEYPLHCSSARPGAASAPIAGGSLRLGGARSTPIAGARFALRRSCASGFAAQECSLRSPTALLRPASSRLQGAKRRAGSTVSANK